MVNFVFCPNCGFNSAPGTMFCGKCGSRLNSAPAQQNTYSPPAQPYIPQTPPQRASYIPTPPPVDTVNPYQGQVVDAASKPNYQTYGSSMMQSPYITGAFRTSAPVLSSSREGAAQYTAVSTNVYSPQARAAAIANEKAIKKKKAGSIIMTVFAVLLLAGMAGILYFSGIFEQSDNGIYIPPSSGESITAPDNTPIVSGSDEDSDDAEGDAADETSDSDIEDDSTHVPDGSAVPRGMSISEFADINAFISAFTETGLTDINASLTADDLAAFAISSLSMNSSVYSHISDGFSYGNATYNYSFSESLVKQRICHYFGDGALIYPAAGDSGDGWLYYGGSYYFTEIAQSQGFAILTGYSDAGDVATVSFRLFASQGDDSPYYYMTAKNAEGAGCTAIGDGTAVLGKTSYNGRETYLIQSIETNLY